MHAQTFADTINQHLGDERKLSVRQAQGILDALLSNPKLAQQLVQHVAPPATPAEKAPEAPPAPAPRRKAPPAQPAQPAQPEQPPV
jgi:hypothetical protein